MTDKERLDKIYKDIEDERHKLQKDFGIDLSLIPVDDVIELIDFLMSNVSRFERKISSVWIKRNVRKFIKKKRYKK